MSIANLLNRLRQDKTLDIEKDEDEIDKDFWNDVAEKHTLKMEYLALEKENKAKMHIWTEAYLVYLRNHLPEQARILADDATDIYMQKYNGEI